jgi:alkanesulfonate monooxygenase SsuD/methylene tetrahydromethanopterin reductase-like flavin-dependent oxidoreductase (luciferase family)
LKDAQLMLRPVQQPHPPVWVAANSDAAITRAARLGYTWYVNPHAKFETISQQVEMYHEAAGAANSGAPERLPLGREVFVGRTHEEAYASAAPYLGGKYEAYAQWGQDKALPGNENFREPFEDLARDRFVIGSADEVVEELSRYRELGMSHGCFRMMWPGMPLDDGIANLELFADRVAPHLRED